MFFGFIKCLVGKNLQLLFVCFCFFFVFQIFDVVKVERWTGRFTQIRLKLYMKVSKKKLSYIFDYMLKSCVEN